MKLQVDYLSKWLLTLIALALCNFAIAQRSIQGTVTDEATGEALIGANILVMGTSSGTVTDFDGAFSLTVPAGFEVLEFSYTGYTTKRITLGPENVLNVTLSAGQLLDEVVVTGYTTQRAREVTSAITSVKAEDFNQGNVTNPAQLLQGKVPGLTITRPGTDPNAGFAIRLRGLSTFGANIQPLIIIDGAIGASLANVDPLDIESIDVLKDGSAAAIYGTRASSGVIIITTKRGREGVTTVDYNGFVSFDGQDRTISVMTPQEYLAIGGTNFGTQTNWIDEITRTGISQSHNLSLSGGARNTSYRVALNYRNVNGIALNNGFNRLNGRLNLSQSALNNRLKLNGNLTITTSNHEFGFNQAFRYATIYNPTAPIRVTEQNNPTQVPVSFFDQYGGYFQQDLFDFLNPVAILEQNINDGRENTILGSFQASYDILPGLTAGAFYSREYGTQLIGRYYSKQSFFVGTNRNGFAERIDNQRYNELFNTTLQYVTDFGSTTFKALGGYEWNELNFEGFSINGGDFVTDAFTYNRFGTSRDFRVGLGQANSYRNDYRNIAFFGQLEFNFDNTFFVRGILRREGNSRFGPENKWGTFPAISGGVDLTRALGITGFDNLKLRVGYGLTGAIPGQNFLSQLIFQPAGNFFFNGNYVPSYGPNQAPNPNLKWERKGETNIGVDFSLFSYRLSGSIDVYDRTTRDLIFNATVPVPPNISSTKFLNLGELRNRGLELGLNYIAVDKPKFRWETAPNLNIVRTKLISLSNDEFDFGSERLIANAGSPGQNNQPMLRLKEGEPIGQIFGPVFIGVGENGVPLFEGVTPGQEANPSDYQVLGNGYPDFEFGWNNTFRMGKFDFNFFLRGAVGHSLINQFRQFYEPLDNVTWNRINTKFFDPNLRNAAYSSYYVEDASFMRLDNATLGYSFSLPSGAAFKRIRLYLSGQNLFTITGYTGVDPEVRYLDLEEGNNALQPGIDRRNTYYLARTILFGVNFGF
jgi:TonB-linked SusC/RagA family outer membrane protein